MSKTIPPRVRWLLQAAVGREVQRIVRAETDDMNDGTCDGLASMYGVSEDTIKRWARGDGLPNYPTALRLAPELGIDPDTAKKVKS